MGGAANSVRLLLVVHVVAMLGGLFVVVELGVGVKVEDAEVAGVGEPPREVA